jgi:predicted nucleic acid-binding protein
VEPPLITLDTSGVLALLSRRDPAHEPATEAFAADPGPYLVPAATLGEIGYFVESRLGAPVLDGFLGDLAEGAFELDCGRDDFKRVRELVARYDDLPLGLVDAAVIACAERNGGRLLTLDVRDFAVVAREGTISILPAAQ